MKMGTLKVRIQSDVPVPVLTDQRRILPSRTLRRVATILDFEADIVAHSYDCTIGRTEAEVHRAPEISDATERRRFREYRRLAGELRAAADCTYKSKARKR